MAGHDAASHGQQGAGSGDGIDHGDLAAIHLFDSGRGADLPAGGWIAHVDDSAATHGDAGNGSWLAAVDHATSGGDDAGQGHQHGSPLGDGGGDLHHGIATPDAGLVTPDHGHHGLG